jgi:uncharacterized protein (DUF1330 family)
MRTTYKVAVALVIGTSTGYVAAQTIRTQGAKPPPAYIIAEVEADPAKQANPVDAKRYAEEAPKSLAAFQARYLVRGGNVQALEGDAPKGYIVVIAFDSVEQARGWYNSPAYEAIKPIRQNTTKSRLLLAEGVISP